MIFPIQYFLKNSWILNLFSTFYLSTRKDISPNFAFGYLMTLKNFPLFYLDSSTENIEKCIEYFQNKKDALEKCINDMNSSTGNPSLKFLKEIYILAKVIRTNSKSPIFKRSDFFINKRVCILLKRSVYLCKELIKRVQRSLLFEQISQLLTIETNEEIDYTPIIDLLCFISSIKGIIARSIIKCCLSSFKKRIQQKYMIFTKTIEILKNDDFKHSLILDLEKINQTQSKLSDLKNINKKIYVDLILDDGIQNELKGYLKIYLDYKNKPNQRYCDLCEGKNHSIFYLNSKEGCSNLQKKIKINIFRNKKLKRLDDKCGPIKKLKTSSNLESLCLCELDIFKINIDFQGIHSRLRKRIPIVIYNKLSSKTRNNKNHEIKLSRINFSNIMNFLLEMSSLEDLIKANVGCTENLRDTLNYKKSGYEKINLSDFEEGFNSCLEPIIFLENSSKSTDDVF